MAGWQRELVERGDSVFVAVRYPGRGRSSGLPIDQPVAHVWELSRRFLGA